MSAPTPPPVPRRAVFVRLGSRPIPRVQRMMQVAEELGLAPLFVGARRDRGLAARDRWEGWEVRRIGPHFPLVNGRQPVRYVLGVLRFGLALLGCLRRERPALVHVSDFELFAPARLYTLLARVPLLYNVHDNLAQRYRVPAPVAWLLNAAEGLAARLATVTLVPEAFRRDALPRWARVRVHVVRNTPVDPGYTAPRERDDGQVVLFFAGWLDAGRGVRPLAALAAATEGLRLEVAGEGDAALEAELRAAPSVTSLGYLSHAAIMERTAACDFVTALYDPRRPINRFAASNKIAEALAVGRPLLINAELEIAKLLAPYGCTVTVPYDEIEGAGERLRGLRADPGHYLELCRAARRAYEEHYAWERVREASCAAFRAAGVPGDRGAAPRPAAPQATSAAPADVLPPGER